MGALISVRLLLGSLGPSGLGVGCFGIDGIVFRGLARSRLDLV